jgi:hypothetical protein
MRRGFINSTVGGEGFGRFRRCSRPLPEARSVRRFPGQGRWTPLSPGGYSPYR